MEPASATRLGRLALLFVFAALPAHVAGQGWDVSADLAVQTRLFTDDARWPGQAGERAQLSLAGRAEFRWRSESGDQRASIIPFVRWDLEDSDRNLVDLQEAYWAWEGADSELLVGANTVFWGVTESVHLVDIVNQTDIAGDVDGEDKLGQPMVNLALHRDWGLVSAYVMPYFRERTFPGTAGRFRTPLPIDTGRPRYGSGERQRHVDVALRYSHYFGDVDIGLSAFSGTSREPRLLPDANGTALVPVYDPIDQAGLDLQLTRDAWLWKLETILRNGYADTFTAAVGGFEYTLFQVRETDTDVGLLLEYQYDGRAESEPFVISDNDLFLATRIALNDAEDSTLLAGMTYDLESGESFFNIEAERRLGQSYVLELRARVFSGADPGEITYSLSTDDYIQLELTKFF